MEERRAHLETNGFSTADVELSDQFFGWVAGLGGMLKIEGPSDAVDPYKRFLQSELARYQTEL